MLASFFQFSFLCVVAIANLCLGFVLASRLGFGPSIAALFELNPALPEQSESPSGPLEPSASIDNSEPSAENSADESPDTESNDSLDAVEETEEAASHDQDVDESQTDSIHGAIEDVFELLTEREASVMALMEKLNPENDVIAPADAEATADELTTAVQEFLQKLNSMSDLLNQKSDSEVVDDTPKVELSKRLSDLWSDINDTLVQTVILNYDEASINDSVATLKTTIDEIAGHCKHARQQLNEMLETVAAD